ncbi:MAG: hypothetical protein HY678_02635 [Chloroflexi bacterium]|nr:hypothetical protein [Chloroflexota bacterium]
MNRWRDGNGEVCGEWEEEGLGVWHDGPNSVVFVGHLRRGIAFLFRDEEAVSFTRVVQRAYMVARRAGAVELAVELGLEDGACAVEIGNGSDPVKARVCILTGEAALSLPKRKITVDFDRQELRTLGRLTLDAASHLSAVHGVKLT